MSSLPPSVSSFTPTPQETSSNQNAASQSPIHVSVVSPTDDRQLIFLPIQPSSPLYEVFQGNEALLREYEAQIRNGIKSFVTGFDESLRRLENNSLKSITELTYHNQITKNQFDLFISFISEQLIPQVADPDHRSELQKQVNMFLAKPDFGICARCGTNVIDQHLTTGKANDRSYILQVLRLFYSTILSDH